MRLLDTFASNVLRAGCRPCISLCIEPGSMMTEDELMHFLIAIETGEVLLTPAGDPQEVYSGCVHYAADNGWKIAVFNDANAWDYIDEVTTSDGRALDSDQIEAMKPLHAYKPTEEIAWLRYGIPGYRKYRCRSCGVFLEGERFPPFICGSC